MRRTHGMAWLWLSAQFACVSAFGAAAATLPDAEIEAVTEAEKGVEIEAEAPAPQQRLARNESIDFVRRRGIEIYERHQAALVALNAALEVGLEENAPEGWITLQEDSGYRVRFISECADGPCSLIDVVIDDERLTAEALYPPVLLAGDEVLAWRARQLVFATQTVMCDTAYNAVVLPPETPEGEWTAYLIAQPDQEDVIAVGGHARVYLDPEAGVVHRAEDLSVSCVLIRRDPEQGVMALTYPQSPLPAETHVFTSLHAQVMFYVGTGEGVFLVNGDDVRLVSEVR